mgnify:CR=1 FL=1
MYQVYTNPKEMINMLWQSSKFWISWLFILNFTGLITDGNFGFMWFLNLVLGIVGLIFLASAIVDWRSGANSGGSNYSGGSHQMN